jgi:hypothetical protein
MGTDVESIAFMTDRSGKTADLIQTLEHDGRRAISHGLERRSHAGRTGANNYNPTRFTHSDRPFLSGGYEGTMPAKRAAPFAGAGRPPRLERACGGDGRDPVVTLDVPHRILSRQIP